MRIIKMLAISATTAFCIAAPALAVAEGVRPVSLTGLDLGAPAGQAEALKRIHKAAADLCRNDGVEGVDQQDDWLRFQDCVKRASAEAMARLPSAIAVAKADPAPGPSAPR